MNASIETKKIFAIGTRSFLAEALGRAWHQSEGFRLDFVDGRTASKEALEEADVVVNFCADPRYRAEPYRPELDVDVRMAQLLTPRCRFVMLSSRKVYAPQFMMGANENSPLGPIDIYGANKLETERRLLDLLGERLVTLRVANVIGYEYHAKRNSFMKMLTTNLRDRGQVILDVSPTARRDFIPDDHFGRRLAQLLKADAWGTINFGSGIPTKLGDLAGWVIEGFGRGEVVVTKDEVRDEFVLDVEKLRGYVGDICTDGDIRESCMQIGRRLGRENEVV